MTELGDGQLKDLVITGPDAEIHDATDGRRFFYYFDETAGLSRPLTEVVQAGAFRFALKFGRRPTVVLLSASYSLTPGVKVAGFRIILLPDMPPGHFWFGPKPHYYQLRFDL